MSKRKRNVKSPLGHDPFESMTDFEIEGPAPEAQQEVKRPAPKPQIRRAFKKVETGGEKPKAFAIADFFTTLVKPQPETKPADEDDTAVAEIAEGVKEEVEAASFLADEGAAVAEPTVAEEDEAQELDEEVFELDTAVWESTDTNEAEDSAADNDDFVFDITRVSFPETLEEEMLEEEDEPDQTAAALPETAILSDDTDETDDNEAEASELISISDELPETAVLTTDTDSEEDEDPEEEAPLFDTAVLADDKTVEPQTELLDEPLPETAAWSFEDADTDDTVLALDDPADALEEEEDDEDEEDDIFPTAAELLGILDTAELALSVEHELALSHDDEDDDEEDVWGATSPLDPDLDFEWADDGENEEDPALPNWLTDSTSAEKFDTDSLNPLLQEEEEEPPTAEPDLDFNWEEDEHEEDDSLPEWLTAETAASKIDTDKLNPEVADTAEKERDEDPSSMATKVLKSAQIDDPDLNEAGLWLEEGAPEPDWLLEANQRYADDDEDEDEDDLAETLDWLTADLDEEEQADLFEEDEAELNQFSESSIETAQLTSSLLNDWLENTAHDTEEEDADWFTASNDEQTDEEAEMASWVEEQTADLDWGSAAVEPQLAEDEEDEFELPEWIDTEDSFAVMEEEETADESLFPADLFNFENLHEEKSAAAPPHNLPSVEQMNTADPDEIEFDFSFYETAEGNEAPDAESIDNPEEPHEEVTFDVADFAFEALESDTAVEDVNPNLDEILNRFSSLPATQILPSTLLDKLEPDNDEVKDDLFDFKFDRFELASNRPTNEKDLDDLVNRLATLPMTQPLQTSSDNLIDPNFADEAESNVLFSLLREIDAEMGVTYPKDDLEYTAVSAAQPAKQSTPFGATKGQFVVFILGDMAYAFPLDQVEEITQPPEIEAIPNVPRWVRGAVDIDNHSIPVIDLRRFFGIRSHTKKSSERVLVVHDAAEKVRAGLFVDEVKAVRSIPNGEINPLTNTEQIAPTIRPYTYGFYNKIILLDINRLFDSPDMAHIGLKTS